MKPIIIDNTGELFQNKVQNWLNKSHQEKNEFEEILQVDLHPELHLLD